MGSTGWAAKCLHVKCLYSNLPKNRLLRDKMLNSKILINWKSLIIKVALVDINLLSLRKNIHLKTFQGILPSESLHYVKHLKKQVCCCYQMDQFNL